MNKTLRPTTPGEVEEGMAVAAHDPDLYRFTGGQIQMSFLDMSPNEYQWLAARTLVDGSERTLTGDEFMLVWCATGLAGEVGEVQEYVKKAVFHQHGTVDNAQMINELGDVMWYVAGICSVLGLKLSDVMDANIRKLQTRYPDGFNREASVARKDTA
jgi:NTP pyrophosphatase (non-canonical NTP hydrolase)